MKKLARLAAVVLNVIAYGLLSGALAPTDDRYLLGLTTLMIVGLGSALIGGGLSAAGSAYGAHEQSEASEAGVRAMLGKAGLLGPAGLFMGSDNLALLKDTYNDILSEKGFEFLGSPEYAQRNKFYAHLSDDEKALIQQATAFGMNPPEAEGLGLAYLRDLLSGSYLPGGENENEFLRRYMDEISRRGDEERRLASDQFRSQTRNILGGSLGGAGSAIPEIQRLDERFQMNTQDAINRVLAGTYESGQDRMLRGAGLTPAYISGIFDRYARTYGFASIPRQLKDLGIQRAFQAFTDRVGRLVGFAGQAGSQIVGSGTSFAPALGNAVRQTADMTTAAALQGAGQTFSSLGSTMGLLGAFGGGGAPAGGAGAGAPASAPVLGGSYGGFNPDVGFGAPTGDYFLGGTYYPAPSSYASPYSTYSSPFAGGVGL